MGVQKKKPYFPPSLRELTPEQAKKIVMERKHCSEEEASELLNSLKQQPQQTGKDQERKRTA